MTPRQEKTSALWARALSYVGLSSMIPLSTAAGCLGGWYLDRALHTELVFTVVGGIAGTAVGIVELVQLIARTEKQAERQDETDGEPKS